MNPNAPIYGHSRGYRLLALLSIAAVVVSFLDFDRPTGLSVVGIVGIVGFTGLFLYSWRRATKRVVVMQIEDTGFAVVDPTQHFGLIEFDEIDEIRIYALLEQPMVAFRLADPNPVRRRGAGHGEIHGKGAVAPASLPDRRATGRVERSDRRHQERRGQGRHPDQK